MSAIRETNLYMNIFYLNSNPRLCAKYHVDKHCVKMIVEYSQLLSTAHRVLDGYQSIEVVNNRKLKRWVLDNQLLDSVLYKATHVNHPSAVWVRQSSENYMWLAQLLWDLSDEYTYRYGKVHKCMDSGLIQYLFEHIPKSIPRKQFTEPTPAMPDKYKVPASSMLSYHNYYNGDKRKLFSWKFRNVPEFITGLE